MTNKKTPRHESQPKMEGTVCLVAEWISLAGMKALQSACMFVSITAREKDYEEFLMVWKNVRRMAAIRDGKGRKPSRVIQVSPNDAI